MESQSLKWKIDGNGTRNFRIFQEKKIHRAGKVRKNNSQQSLNRAPIHPMYYSSQVSVHPCYPSSPAQAHSQSPIFPIAVAQNPHNNLPRSYCH